MLNRSAGSGCEWQKNLGKNRVAELKKDDGKKRPNVLWIQTDEHRPDSLGCYGSEWARTPNLDKLAARGAVFHECHVQSPTCVPSRTSMLTCKYPQELNVLENSPAFRDGFLGADEKLIPNLFADAGYQTASIGKWHTPSTLCFGTPTNLSSISSEKASVPSDPTSRWARFNALPSGGGMRESTL